MKKLATLSLIALAFGTVSVANAASSCATREAQLQKQIAYAQAAGNYHEVLGLKKALAEVKAHCTPASVAKDTQKEIRKLQEKIADKREDIADVQRDLRKAQLKGDRKKVAKYQAKLAEKNADLQELQAKLRAAQAGQ